MKLRTLLIGASLLLLAACGTKTLTDADLVTYVTTPFSRQEMMFKKFILGMHNGMPVYVEFPCSDLCPDATTLYLYYDIDINNCEKVGGVLKEFPSFGWRPAETHCIPKAVTNIEWTTGIPPDLE